MRAWLAVAGALFALVGLAGEWRRPVNGDAAYILDAARRMGEGARLYRDLIDLNPPFIFWLARPVVAAGDMLGVGPVLVFRLAVLAIVALGGWLTWRLIGGSSLSSRVRAAVLFAFVLVSLGIPVLYFGEREHLLFALLFPFVILGALRASGDPVPRGLAIAAGAAAGVAILLKPPALLAAIALLSLVILARRSARALLNPEAGALAAVLAAGAVLVLVAAPDYVGVVRRYGSIYWAFSNRPASVVASRDVHAWTIWLGLALVPLAVRSLRDRSLALALAAGTAGLFAAVFTQGKGFGYHYFPALGLAVTLLFVSLLGETREGASGLARRTLSGLALAATVGLFFLPAAWRRAVGGDSPFERQAREAGTVLTATPSGSTMMVLSSRLTDAFPAAVEAGLRYRMRLAHLWFVPALYPEAELAAVQPRLPAEMNGAERELYSTVGEDLARERPALLLVRDPDGFEQFAGDIQFDYLPYFCADPVFADAARSYRREPATGGFTVFRRDTTSRPEVSPCASS